MQCGSKGCCASIRKAWIELRWISSSRRLSCCTLRNRDEVGNLLLNKTAVCRSYRCFCWWSLLFWFPLCTHNVLLTWFYGGDRDFPTTIPDNRTGAPVRSWTRWHSVGRSWSLKLSYRLSDQSPRSLRQSHKYASHLRPVFVATHFLLQGVRPILRHKS